MARPFRHKTSTRRWVLFVEGQTELEYFSLLKGAYRWDGVEICRLANTGSDEVDKAERYLKHRYGQKKFDGKGLIFDADTKTKERLQALCSKALAKDYSLGISSKSFEVWLLAHFEQITSGVLSKEALSKRLSEKLKKDYKKANYSQLKSLVANVEVAIENVKQVNEINDGFQYTTLGELIIRVKGDETYSKSS